MRASKTQLFIGGAIVCLSFFFNVKIYLDNKYKTDYIINDSDRNAILKYQTELFRENIKASKENRLPSLRRVDSIMGLDIEKMYDKNRHIYYRLTFNK